LISFNISYYVNFELLFKTFPIRILDESWHTCKLSHDTYIDGVNITHGDYTHTTLLDATMYTYIPR